MYDNYIILAAIWLLYCFTHSLLANERIKKKMEQYVNISSHTYRLGYNIIAALGLAAVLIFQFSIPGITLFANPIINGPVAGFLILAGGIIMIICILKYFKQLSGIVAESAEKPSLETGGIHRYVRHPLYLGTFLFLIGMLLWFPYLSNLIAVSIIIVYTIIGIRWEEKKLISQFGEAYKRYQAKVPMLIPFTK